MTYINVGSCLASWNVHNTGLIALGLTLMPDTKQITMWRVLAENARKQGDQQSEADALRRLVAYTASIIASEADDQVTRQRATSSHRLADLLSERGEWPEAMQAYQEATDAYSLLDNCGDRASECARRIQDGVRALRSRPYDRLYLLIARYEREIRQFEVEEGRERDRADRLFHIGDILNRRDRSSEAVSRYEEALKLYAQVEETESEQANCCKILGDIYFNVLEDDVRAFSYYRRAERLYLSIEMPSDSDTDGQEHCARRLRELATDLSEIH